MDIQKPIIKKYIRPKISYLATVKNYQEWYKRFNHDNCELCNQFGPVHKETDKIAIYDLPKNHPKDS